MSVSGLSHITFVVADLQRTAALFQAVFGAQIIYESGEATFSLAREIFLDIGGVWVALMEGERPPGRSYDHVAFKIDEADFEACLARVQQAGVEMKEPRPRVIGEGRSIYFHDHDGHLFELHTGTRSERLARYMKGPPDGKVEGY
jgi:fosfomycin resistance protein FosX